MDNFLFKSGFFNKIKEKNLGYRTKINRDLENKKVRDIK